MEDEFTCKTCGYVTGVVADKRVARECGRNVDALEKQPELDTCCYYHGAPDPKTHKYFTKPKCVLEGAECFHWISEDEAEKMHIPNYVLPF